VTPAAVALLISLSTASPVGTVDPGKPVTAAAAETPPPNLVVPLLHGLALMTAMRAAETVLWPVPFAQPEVFGHNYEEAFTRPPKFDPKQPWFRWDGDPLVVNVVGHGLFGSELYLRARQCRLGWAGSLAFAAGASALWEYAFEANGARPSAQDLVYTPLAGLVFGEARFALFRAAGGLSSRAAREVLRAIADPLGELERAAGTDC
jgi:hypothetical protein